MCVEMLNKQRQADGSVYSPRFPGRGTVHVTEEYLALLPTLYRGAIQVQEYEIKQVVSTMYGQTR
jgi:hypothetical protein